MTYGTIPDLQALEGVAGPEEFREVLENAPPGVFDARSWSYWNLKYGPWPAPSLPVREGLFATRPPDAKTHEPAAKTASQTSTTAPTVSQ